jgi:hypothetical protein
MAQYGLKRGFSEEMMALDKAIVVNNYYLL